MLVKYDALFNDKLSHVSSDNVVLVSSVDSCDTTDELSSNKLAIVLWMLKFSRLLSKPWGLNV